MKTNKLIRAALIGVGMTAFMAGAASAKTLVYCSEGSPEGFNPALYTSGTSFDASSRQIFNRLVEFERGTTKIGPALAESWSVSDDGLEYTFKLRPGVKFHSTDYFTPTRDLNADDVVFSMLRYGDLDSGAGRSGLWRNYTQEAKAGGVNLVDESTVEFNLQFPSLAFMKFLALDYVKVLPRHLLDAGIDLNLPESIMENNSGSGPYILDEYQRGNSYRVSKNDGYFKEGRPFFDGINHFIVTEPATLVAQM